MSSGFAMVALRRRRGTFIVLTVVCVAAFFAVGVFGAKALEQSRIDAQATAKGLATAGVASVLETSDTEAVIDGGQGRDLLDRLQRGVLADGTVFRIRVWSPEGDLLFSTDAADQPGELLGDFPSIAVATTGGGKPVSVLSADGEIYQTYVPLRLGGPDALGAVQVDQGYQPIAQRVASPWSLLRMVAIAGAILFLLLAVVATLPIGVSRDGGFVSAGRRRAAKAASGDGAGRRGATASMKELARAETRAEDAETKRDELERQIGQLRTQVSSADENAGRKIAELEAALEEARVGKAVAEAAPADDPAARGTTPRAGAAGARGAGPCRPGAIAGPRSRSQGRANSKRRRPPRRPLMPRPPSTPTSWSPCAPSSPRRTIARSRRCARPPIPSRSSWGSRPGCRSSKRRSPTPVRTHRRPTRSSMPFQAEAGNAEADVEANTEALRHAEERARAAEEQLADLQTRLGQVEATDSNAATLIAQLEGQLMEERGRTAELEAELTQQHDRASRALESSDETERRAAERDVELGAAKIRATEAEREAAELRTSAHQAQATGHRSGTHDPRVGSTRGPGGIDRRGNRRHVVRP